jgi:hypothetical protein
VPAYFSLLLVMIWRALARVDPGRIQMPQLLAALGSQTDGHVPMFLIGLPEFLF